MITLNEGMQAAFTNWKFDDRAALIDFDDSEKEVYFALNVKYLTTQYRDRYRMMFDLEWCHNPLSGEHPYCVIDPEGLEADIDAEPKDDTWVHMEYELTVGDNDIQQVKEWLYWAADSVWIEGDRLVTRFNDSLEQYEAEGNPYLWEVTQTYPGVKLVKETEISRWNGG